MMQNMSRKLTEAQLQKIVDVLLTAKSDKQTKLRFGQRQRLALVQSIKEQKPAKDHYRYKWLQKARNAVIEAIKESAVEFNKEHPYDMIALSDYIDVLESVRLIVDKNLED